MSTPYRGGVATLVGLGVLLLMLLLLWLFIRRAGRERGFPFRSIAAFEALRGLLSRAAETGQSVHLSLGSAALGGEQTPAISAGLTVLRYLADQGAAFGTSPIITVADAALMLVAQDELYRAYRQKQMVKHYHPTDVRLIAPDPTAYAVGAQDTIDLERVSANVMVGSFGGEYLLIGEPTAEREIVQVVGSNAVGVQPLMVVTSDQVLLGEEMFAAGAYLTRRSKYIASLRLQDTLRILIILAIALGVLAKTVFG
jgi:hypothetical protein